MMSLVANNITNIKYNKSMNIDKLFYQFIVIEYRDVKHGSKNK